MGTFKFSMTILKKEFKKSIIFGLTMLFSISMSLVFFDIINNPHLQDTVKANGGTTFATMQLPFASSLSFVIILFCGFMIFFANNFYLSKKTGEIAILSMSGLSSFQSTLYLIYQTFALILIALPLGILLGQGLTIIMHYWIYDYLNIHASLFYTPVMTYIQTVIFVLVMMFLLCVLESGFIYRHDIQSLLMENKEMEFKDRRIIKFPYVVYGICYIGGIVMMFTEPHQSTSYIVPTFLGIYGAIGLLRYVLAKFIRKLKEGPLLTKKYALIYTSNLCQSIQQAYLLVALLVGSITSMMTIIMSCRNSYREFVVAIMGYVVVIVLLTVSVIYKFLMEAQMRKGLFYNLWKVGYTKCELKKIARNEVVYFYLSLFLIPFVYIVIILGRFVYFDHISLWFVLMMTLFYMIPLILSTIFTYIQYKKSVIDTIQGR
ncbi:MULTISPECIES: FtsX-like permease family protein [Coprobacillaceae]|uniref:FtsX-like permease family protein n=1 Tax=Coprobacillaceae TaxID=2810280 RepID=UPI000E4A63C0|nr:MULTISPECIES: FtsX-like permease family protein [Coprobacillaceae]RHM60348.1 ABC transporter permease [Coprobacillus sp. AF33-1AC]RHS92871.1 ABC transporter permease [Erysipelatoclostridium sp. AM42-17]